jgi:hypothetical protein
MGPNVEEYTMRHLSAVTLVCAITLTAVGCSDDATSPPAVVEIALAPASSGNGQSGEVNTALGQNLRVLVTRNSLPAPDVTVQWAVPAGNGALPGASTTNADGIALAIWTMPTTIGDMSATASVAGPATSFEVLAGNNQVVAPNGTAGEPLTVILEDTYGNPVSGVAVGWSIISGFATLSDPSVDTDATGRASVSVTAEATPGAVVIRAIPGVTLPGVDFNLTVTP